MVAKKLYLDKFREHPRVLALCIGINKYEELETLQYPASDAENFENQLLQLNNEDNVIQVILGGHNKDKQLKKEALEDLYLELWSAASKSSQLQILLSVYGGHGVHHAGHDYMLCSDYVDSHDHQEMKYMFSQQYRCKQLLDVISSFKELDAHVEKYFIHDACREFPAQDSASAKEVYEKLPQNTLIIFSSERGQKVQDNRSFTAFLTGRIFKNPHEVLWRLIVQSVFMYDGSEHKKGKWTAESVRLVPEASGSSQPTNTSASKSKDHHPASTSNVEASASDVAAGASNVAASASNVAASASNVAIPAGRFAQQAADLELIKTPQSLAGAKKDLVEAEKKKSICQVTGDETESDDDSDDRMADALSQDPESSESEPEEAMHEDFAVMSSDDIAVRTLEGLHAVQQSLPDIRDLKLCTVDDRQSSTFSMERRGDTNAAQKAVKTLTRFISKVINCVNKVVYRGMKRAEICASQKAARDSLSEYVRNPDPHNPNVTIQCAFDEIMGRRMRQGAQIHAPAQAWEKVEEHAKKQANITKEFLVAACEWDELGMKLESARQMRQMSSFAARVRTNAFGVSALRILLVKSESFRRAVYHAGLVL
jgi:hypothetical protein